MHVAVQNTAIYSSRLRFSNEEYYTSLIENTTSLAPKRLIEVNATDSGGGGVLYSILNPNKIFTIDAISGVVSWTGAACDRETASVFKLLVQVCLYP